MDFWLDTLSSADLPERLSGVVKKGIAQWKLFVKWKLFVN
jgi:hypothetical protein